MSAMAFDKVFKLGDPRRMTAHLVEFEALDMLEFADHGDQRRWR